MFVIWGKIYRALQTVIVRIFVKIIDCDSTIGEVIAQLAGPGLVDSW